MNETTYLVFAVAIIGALVAVGIAKILERVHKAETQAEEAVAMAGWHALLKSRIEAKFAVEAANAELVAIEAKINEFKSEVAGNATAA